jgi:hypothetical protein
VFGHETSRMEERIGDYSLMYGKMAIVVIGQVSFS